MLSLSHEVESCIDVDIIRSFCSMDGITGDNLKNILKTYAVCNPDLDYCQGMNFIAGFLYLFLGEEALAFAVMRRIIK